MKNNVEIIDKEIQIKPNPKESLRRHSITLKELLVNSEILSEYWQDNIVVIELEGEVIFKLYRNHDIEVDKLDIIVDGEFNEDFPHLVVKNINFDFKKNQVNIEVIEPREDL